MNWNNGDVFFWKYKDLDRAYSRDSMWCKSGIGIVRNGVLNDTFWGNDSSKVSFDSLDEIEIEYKGNLSDYHSIREYDAPNYSPDDVLDLNHSNSTKGNVYLKNGAVKHRETMLKNARENLADAHREFQMAALRVEWAAKKVAEIEASSDLTNVII